MHRSMGHGGSLCSLLALTLIPLAAQGIQTAEVNGEVKDTHDAPLAGATVTLTSPALQGTRTYATDARGRFSARLLPPGEYMVRIALDGFQTLKATQKLALGQSYSPRYGLQPIGAAVVEVVAALAQLDRTTVGTSTNYQMDRMENLPIGRSPEAMLAMTPGVVNNSPTGFGMIRGALSSGNKFLIDGQNVNDAVYGNRSVMVIDDAIAEVQVITGAISAEYGDVDGGVVNTVTRSGGNEFTGTLRFEGGKDSWNAVQPLEHREAIRDNLIYDERFSLGGYLVKDKLWFFLSGYQQDQSTSQAISRGPYSGTPYTTSSTDQRLQSKFSWQIGPEHALSLAYLTSRRNLGNNDFDSGDLTALEPQKEQNSAWSLNWLANWSATLSMEARLGEKKEGLTAGGTLPGVVPIMDTTTGLFFRNGVLNARDGGDHRDNRSADVKFTVLWEAAGSHETAFGLNWMKGIRRAELQQSPTNTWFYVHGYNPKTPAQATQPANSEALPVLMTWFSSPTRAYDTTEGLYLNDKWSLGRHLSFNLGLRWDQYHASSDDTPASAGARGWSPRLGLKYDVFGDARWQAAASFSRYNAAPLAPIVNAVSAAGNPTQVDQRYTGPKGEDGTITYADLTTPDNYTQQLDYASPLATVLSGGLRPPHTNEVQVSLAHAFRIDDRDAYWKLTLVRRDYKDLFDFRAGNDGPFLPPAPFDQVGPQFLKVWENSALARRTYKDAELETGYQGDRLNLTGALTWSSLAGNYQGEDGGSGTVGAGFRWFSIVNGQTLFDWHPLHPYGPLIGDVPIRIRATADYHWDGPWGRTTLGAIYRFDTGEHHSMSRAITSPMVNPDLKAYGQTTATAWYQFHGDARGTVLYQAQAFTDLTVQQDFKVLALAGHDLRLFAKLVAFNVFNHQQLRAPLNTWQDAQQGLADPWALDGSRLNRNHFGQARTYSIEAGLKF